MRTSRAMVTALVAALLVAGCSSASTQHPATSASTSTDAPAEVDAGPPSAGTETATTAPAVPQPPMDPRFPGHWGIVRGSPRRIAGVVTADGKPAMATISLRGPLTALGALPAITVESGADGRFDLGEQPIAEWELVAQRDGFAPTLIALDLAAAEPVDDLGVGLTACHQRVYGTVSGDGGPIAGATVQLGTWGAVSATTDGKGRYELCTADGDVRLAVLATGYMPSVRATDLDGTTEVDFSLEAAVSVRAQVVDAEGAPLPGILVFARGNELPLLRSAVSDAAGQVRFDGMECVSRLLAERVPPSGALAVGEDSALCGTPGEVLDVTIPVEPGFLLSGRLEQRDVPVADTTVAWTSAYGWTYTASSRIDGSFELWNLPPAALDATGVIDVVGYGACEPVLSVPGDAGQPRTVSLDVAWAEKAIRGRVTHRGRGVARAEVSVPYVGDFVTATDGSFWFGASAITGSLQGSAISARSRGFDAFGRVVIDKDAAYYAAAGLVVDLTATSSVEGVVVDEAGAPVAGAAVALENASSTDYGRATTGPDGRFYARRMAGGESYAVTVWRTWNEVYPPARGKRFKALHLDADGGALRNVKLVVRRTPEAPAQVVPP